MTYTVDGKQYIAIAVNSSIIASLDWTDLIGVPVS